MAQLLLQVHQLEVQVVAQVKVVYLGAVQQVHKQSSSNGLESGDDFLPQLSFRQPAKGKKGKHMPGKPKKASLKLKQLWFVYFIVHSLYVDKRGEAQSDWSTVE